MLRSRILGQVRSALHQRQKTGRWGFMTKYSDVHHGYSGAAYRLFVHNGAGKITDSTLFAEADNEGALGDCSENRYEDRENTAEERRECQKARYSLSSTIKVLESGKSNAGFYPIRLTVSGFDGFKNEYAESYADPTLPTLNPDNKWDELNSEIKEMFCDFKKTTKESMDIKFITDSMYYK